MRKIRMTLKAIVFTIIILTNVIVPSNFTYNTAEVYATSKPKQPKLNTKTKTLKVGETFQLKIKNPGKYKWKWTSTNKNVLTVDQNGTITAKSIGVSSVKVKATNYSLVCKVDVISAFDKTDAKKSITITPIETCKGLYEVTSTYDIPTMIIANYKIVDNNGVTVTKSSKSVVAVSWDKTYLRIPACENEQTMQLTYGYKECKQSLTKDISHDIYNSIQIYKFERDETKYNSYTVYIKNISNKKYESAIKFNLCAYNNNGNIIGFEEGLYISEMDIDEIISYPMIFLSFIDAKEDFSKIEMKIQYY